MTSLKEGEVSGEEQRVKAIETKCATDVVVRELEKRCKRRIIYGHPNESLHENVTTP